MINCIFITKDFGLNTEKGFIKKETIKVHNNNNIVYNNNIGS